MRTRKQINDKNVILICRRRNYFFQFVFFSRSFVIIYSVWCDMRTEKKKWCIHAYLYKRLILKLFLWYRHSGTVRLIANSISHELELRERNENFWFWFLAPTKSTTQSYLWRFVKCVLGQTLWTYWNKLMMLRTHWQTKRWIRLTTVHQSNMMNIRINRARGFR